MTQRSDEVCFNCCAVQQEEDKFGAICWHASRCSLLFSFSQFRSKTYAIRRARHVTKQQSSFLLNTKRISGYCFQSPVSQHLPWRIPLQSLKRWLLTTGLFRLQLCNISLAGSSETYSWQESGSSQTSSFEEHIINHVAATNRSQIGPLNGVQTPPKHLMRSELAQDVPSSTGKQVQEG